MEKLNKCTIYRSMFFSRAMTVTCKSKSICHCEEQRARVSHLTFKNKRAITTKASLFALQTKHKLRPLRRSAVLLQGRDVSRNEKFQQNRHWSKNVDTETMTHLASRHRWEPVECAPNWQNYTPASLQSCHPSPQ